ncbi:hypothetical protein NUSPORA_00422 [Nucleospora cyclopteri]
MDKNTKEDVEELQHLKYLKEFLTYAKTNIYKNKKISKNSANLLKSIHEILLDNQQNHAIFTAVLEILLPKKGKRAFLEILQNCLLCDQTFKITVRILKIVLENTKILPSSLYSKNFIFFLNEKIFQNLIHLYSNEQIDQIDDTNLIKILSEKNQVQISQNNIIRDLISLVRVILEIERNSLSIVYSTGFFDLISSVVIKETAEVFNAVFQGVEVKNPRQTPQKDAFYNDLYKNYKDGAVFEIQRKCFSPEVIVKNKIVFRFKSIPEKFQNNDFHDKIYNNLKLTVFKELIEFYVEDMLHVLNYSSCNYFSEEIINFIISKFSSAKNKGNPINSVKQRKYEKCQDIKILENLSLYYRKYVENGNSLHEGLLKLFIANMNISPVIATSTILISYYSDLYGLNQAELFNIDIKSLFRTLEYNHPTEDLLKILTVLKKIYQKQSICFFKPTYLMLIRYNLVKVEEFDEICGFLFEYFSDFIDFVKNDTTILYKMMLKEKKNLFSNPSIKNYKLEEQENLGNSSLLHKSSLKMSDSFIESDSDDIKSDLLKTIPETSFRHSDQ